MLSTEAQALAKQLNSQSRKKREAALNHIRALPHEKAVWMIIALGTSLPDERRSGSLLSDAPVIALPMLIIPLTLYLFYVYDKIIPKHLSGPFIIMLVGLYFYFWNQAIKKYQGQWVYPLFAEYENVYLVAPTLRSWKTAPKFARPYLQTCLTRSLPLMTSEAANGMSAPERATLRKLVLSSNPQLCVIILNTLTRMENTSAIPTIETLLTHQISEEVRAAAEACLAQLKAIKAAEQEGKILLRPSHDTTEEKTLLRIAEASKPEDERQLLRPGGGEKNP